MKKFLFVLMALLALARSSMADPRPRVVVLRTPELVHALVVQLEPWDVEIAEADDMPPHTTDQAAVIAEAHAAAALVWASGTELHVYDARTHEMFSRPLGQTLPLDPPAASSVALTVKTMLRSTNVAPAAKQIEQPAPTTTAKPSPLPMAPAPNAPPVKKQTGPPPVAFIEVGLGGKVIATDGELRLSAGFGLHPPKSPFGGALEAHIGTGASFKDGRWVRGLFDILEIFEIELEVAFVRLFRVDRDPLPAWVRVPRTGRRIRMGAFYSRQPVAHLIALIVRLTVFVSLTHAEADPYAAAWAM